MRTKLKYLLVWFLLLSCNKKDTTHRQNAPTRAVSDNAIMLSETQIRLANITTERVSRKNVGGGNFVNGTITVDKQKSVAINSRVGGRIEKLLVKERGVFIRKGEPLYTLYSEGLLTLQQEYLLAKEQYETLGETEKRYKSFFDASERKLLLYGLTKGQINKLSREVVIPRITFLSPASGVIREIQAEEGQYVDEGTSLYNIEDVESLWVEGELYPGEATSVNYADKVVVKVNGFDASPLEATVDFISPEYRANSQVLVIRAKIKNPDLQFRPGQLAQIFFTQSSKETIAVPTDAVIRDGNGTHVYVQSQGAIFRPRMVKTGVEGFDQVEITDGLNEGDTVAVTGAYLLYAEMVLKKGADPMAEHRH